MMHRIASGSSIRNGLLATSLCALALHAHSASATLGTPTVQWQRCPANYCETGWYASPAVLDVDRDGVVDVLWGGYTLVSMRGDTGAIEWSHPAPGGGRIWPGVAVADLDGDGAREIVVAQYNRLSVLHANGTPLANWPAIPFVGGEIRTLAVADLDLDGSAEILVARAGGFSDENWLVLEPSGAVRPGWPRLAPTDPGYAFGAYNQNLAVGDLDADGDGDLEIVGSSDVHYLAAFQDDGALLAASSIYGSSKDWSQVGVHYDNAVDLIGYAECTPGPPADARPNFAESAPAIGDLDGDGRNEVVVIGSFYDCGTETYDQLFQLPIILESDRTRWVAPGYDWTALPVPDAFAGPISIDYLEIESALPNAVLADLDGDGVKEVLYASYDGRVHAFWVADKTEHGTWPFVVRGAPTDKRFASEPVVADLDGDGQAEVVFTTWTAHGSNQGGDLVIVSASGVELSRVALPRSSQNWDGALGAPTLANLDGDPNVEVAVGTTNSGLIVYEIPGSNANRPIWPTGRGNLQRTAPEPTAAASTAVALGALAALAHRRTPA